MKIYIEVNALPGKVTKMLAKKADRVLVCFEQAKEILGGGDKIVQTGAPVRGEILAADRDKARAKFGLREDDQLVISFWGSMGAKYMNEHMAGALALECRNNVSYHHIHATGDLDLQINQALQVVPCFFLAHLSLSERLLDLPAGRTVVCLDFFLHILQAGLVQLLFVGIVEGNRGQIDPCLRCNHSGRSSGIAIFRKELYACPDQPILCIYLFIHVFSPKIYSKFRLMAAAWRYCF